ncbi:hypothetical protein LCGC14_2372090 [marine sediment metagenome]|uniref:Uncharacterized protein n=1 Tax=marine sediment metagenome TaxID=412755 RepID=A0A0F9EY67_9ZZZZ
MAIVDNSPSAQKAKRSLVAAQKSGEVVFKDMADRTEARDLPRWVKLAVAKHELLGVTWKETIENTKHSPSTLSGYKKAPAFKDWQIQLQEIADDPMKIAQLILRSSVAESAMDYLGVIEAAKELGDYKEVRLATKDLLKTYELLKDERSNKGASGPIVVQVNLGNMSVEVPEVEAEYEVLVDEEPDAGTT